MQPTSDGFTHQSRQDDAFAEYEAFVECAVVIFTLAALKRSLTDDEAHLLHLAAELTGRDVKETAQATEIGNATGKAALSSAGEIGPHPHC